MKNEPVSISMLLRPLIKATPISAPRHAVTAAENSDRGAVPPSNSIAAAMSGALRL